MPRFNVIKNSFLAGELSPKLDARTDLPQYVSGCARLENMIVQLQGGARRRPGTLNFVPHPDSTSSLDNVASVLIPFVASETEGYTVVLQSGGGIRIVNAATNWVSETADDHQWADDELNQVQFTQSADVLYLVHPNRPPQRLMRLGTNIFQLRRADYDADSNLPIPSMVPYRDANTDSSLTIAVSGTSVGLKNITFSAGLIQTTHINSFFKLTHGATTGIIEIVSVTSSTTGTAIVVSVLGSTSATDNWAEASWSYFRGWPRTIDFYEDRTTYGGNRAEPDTIWFSGASDYQRMEQAVASDADPFSKVLNSKQVNQIQWLSAAGVLQIGTLGAEWVCERADNTAGFSNTNFSLRRQTAHGSRYVQPANVFNTTLFVPRGGKTIREFGFNFESDSYVADNLGIYADHMAGRRWNPAQIARVSWAETDGVLWCIDDRGGLFGMTRERKQGIASWHSHQIGGDNFDDDGEKRSAFVASVAAVPSSDGSHDDVWLWVQRWVAGTPTFMLEKMGAEYQFDELVNNGAVGDYAPIFVDSAFVYNGVEISEITQSRFAFARVHMLLDGCALEASADVNGKVTFPKAAANVVVGFPYRPLVQTMRVDAGSAIGSSQGSVMRVDRAVVRFLKTVSAFISARADYFGFGVLATDQEENETIVFRDNAMTMDQAVPLFTGDKEINLPMSPDTKCSIFVWSDQPLPMTILGIMLKGDTRDD